MKLMKLLTRTATIAFMVGIRLAAVACIYAAPALLAAFAEWSFNPGDWSIAMRSVLAVIWLAITVLFLIAFLDGRVVNVRKADA